MTGFSPARFRAILVKEFIQLLRDRLTFAMMVGIPVMQLVLFPMLFLSGAMFPLSGLPAWLAFLTRINPLTYAIAPLRQVVFAAQSMPVQAQRRFPTSVTIFGHTLSMAAELAIVAGFALVFLTLAIRNFGRPALGRPKRCAGESGRRPAAVGGHQRTVDVGGLARGQPRDQGRDLVRLGRVGHGRHRQRGALHRPP